MGAADQIDQFRPAGQLALQNLHAGFTMLLIPSVPRRAPGAAGRAPQLARKNIDISGDSSPVKVIHNNGTILRHAKNRIGDFKLALLITTAHHTDSRQGATTKVSDLPV